MSRLTWQTDDVADRYSPTVRRRKLGIELTRLRNAAGLTGEQVAAELQLHQGNLSKMERAKRPVSKVQLIALLDLYKVPPAKRDQLVEMQAAVRKPAWWKGMGVPTGTFVDLEAEAQEIRSYDQGLISGLLQTEAYARAMIRMNREMPEDEVERRVAVRRERGELLDQGVKLWSIMDEAALRRQVGGPRVMAEQLDYLVQRYEQLPHVTVQAVPFDQGEYVGMEGPFAILIYDDYPTVGYVENWGPGRWLEEKKDVDPAEDRWQHLVGTAIKPDRSIDLIKKIAREMRE